MDTLSLKQRTFIQQYLLTGNATEAAMLTYKARNRNVAGVIAYENLRKHKIRSVLDSIYNKAGISDNAIAQSIKERISLGSLNGIKLALKLHGYTI